MKKLTSSLLLSVALLAMSNEILSKKTSRSDAMVDADADMGITDEMADMGFIDSSAPTPTSALNKAKRRAMESGDNFSKENGLEAIVTESKHTCEAGLNKAQEAADHGATAKAGAVYTESLLEDASHPAHKDHADVKKAREAVSSAKKGSESIAASAIDLVKSFQASVAQLVKGFEEKVDALASKTAAQAKLNTNAAAGMATALAKSEIDLKAKAATDTAA